MRIRLVECGCCGKQKEVEWEKWSDEVLMFPVGKTEVRICKECQNKSESFRKNATRYALERINGYGDDRK